MDGKIFISYRREDTEGYAGRIFDHLSEHFGIGRVFMDVDSIPLGDNFATVIEDALKSASVFIALIGNRWMSAVDDEGNLRLKKPNDYVRIEIASALRNEGTKVIPLLVHSATMPSSSALPEDLADLRLRNAMNVSHAGFISDMDRLTEAIENHFEKVGVSVKHPKKKSQFSMPVWGWVGLAALALLLIIFAATGGFKKEPLETQIALAPETSQPAYSDTPTATATSTLVPPTSTETVVPVIEVIPTETPTSTPTPVPTLTTSILVQRGDALVEMVLVADCLINEAGDYDEKNCDLSLTGDGIKNAFYIDSIPVTNEQYAAFLNQNSFATREVLRGFDYDHPDGGVAINSSGEWYRKEGRENYPLIAVSWDWAIKFCSYYGGDLPTSDMWEKAARGNGNYLYPWGNNEVNSSYANYNNRIGDIIPVKSNAKNISPFGVWDMAGNVWEWTSTGVDGKFALKGGSYFSNDFLLRIDQRKIESPEVLLGDFGFRCVCSPADDCFSKLAITPTPNP